MAVQLTKGYKINSKRKQKFDFKEKDKLFTVLRIYRVLLQLLGVLPVLGDSRILNYLQRIWCAVLVLLISYMTVREALQLDESITTLEKGFYLSELIFMVLLPLNIFILSFTHRETFLSICDQYKLLKQQLSLYHGAIRHPYKSIYRTLRLELLWLTFCLLLFYTYCIILNFISNQGRVLAVLRITATFHSGNIIINGNLALYWFSIRAISLASRYLNSILKSFREDWSACIVNSDHQLRNESSSFPKALWFQKEFGFASFNKFWKFDDILVNLNEICCNLDQLMHDIVHIFRIILIMNFVNSFLILVLQSFLIYKYFDNPDARTILLFLLKCARLLLHTFNIIIILLSHNAVINQVSLSCHAQNRNSSLRIIRKL